MPLLTSPTSPAKNGSATRQNGGAGIDGPPPLPPDKRTPDYSTLAGNYGQGGTPPTGQLAEMALEQAMLLEKVNASLAQMLPSYAPFAAQVVAIVRGGVLQALQQGGQPGGMMQGMAPGMAPGAGAGMAGGPAGMGGPGGGMGMGVPPSPASGPPMA